MDHSSDWPMYRHVERQACRMNEMMDRLDVDPLKLVRMKGGEAFSQARLNCIRCVQAVECLAWLNGIGEADDVRHICPNYETLTACARSPR